jgi:hypothetical protein
VAAQGCVALQPPEHWVGSAQSADAHWVPVTVVQAPAPSQVDAIFTVPAEQLAGAHCFSVPG